MKRFERESEEKRMASDASQRVACGNGGERGRNEKKGDERNGARKGEISVSDSTDEREGRKRYDQSDTKKLKMRKRKALQKKNDEIHGIHGMRKREERSCRKRGRKPSKQREGKKKKREEKKKEREGKKRKRGDTSKDRPMHEKRQREAEWDGVVVQIVNDTESVWKNP